LTPIILPAEFSVEDLRLVTPHTVRVSETKGNAQTKISYFRILIMCKVYNTIGSLTAIKSQLKRNNIEDFNSVNDLIAFQNNYEANRKNILTEQSDLITKERNDLSVLVPEGENEIENEKQTLQQKINTEVEQLKTIL
jgi:hypothetical protein